MAQPCLIHEYGQRGRQLDIALFNGPPAQADVVELVRLGKAFRGTSVGCSSVAVTYVTPVYDPVPLTRIEQSWTNLHNQFVDTFNLATSCPQLGRLSAAWALGAYYARLAGYPANMSELADIARMYEAQQYTAAHIGATSTPLRAGVFSQLWVASTDACYTGGLGSVICPLGANFCPTFQRGLYAGRQFVVADSNGPTKTYLGDMGYDHGWATVMMIEAAIRQTDPDLKTVLFRSATTAGGWAMSEPPVRNENYAAKLVWALAQLYNWTGDTRFRDAMLDKIRRSTALGVLMDDGHGNVAGMENVPFSSLTATVARRPGRMWDGHNARPQYGPMNAWALVEAYVALRDWQDVEQAEVRPYAIAMLNNIAWEVNNLGAPNAGMSQIPVALLLGSWKIADYENEQHPDWERALMAVLNMPNFDANPDMTLVTGLQLLHGQRALYQPLFVRDPSHLVRPAPAIAPATLFGVSAVLGNKTGTVGSRSWTFRLSNDGIASLTNARLTSLTLAQTFGAACHPIVGTPLPLGIGTVSAGGDAQATAVINFTGCPANARFTVTAGFQANIGLTTGTATMILNNLYR